MTKTSANYQAVISSRVRLARNLEGQLFVHRMTAAQKADLLDDIEKAVNEKAIDWPSDDPLSFYRMETMDKRERALLLEKHLISPAFFAMPQGRGLILNKARSISVMVNQEDHLRIQGFSARDDLSLAYERARSMDQALEAFFPYATDPQLGYLTPCPTNIGTGMRASLMVFLPVLSKKRTFAKIKDHLAKKGYLMRGFYGERSRSLPGIYQVSNQMTLGLGEEDILQGVEEESRRLILQEEEAVAAWDQEIREAFMDRAYKAYGRLAYARLVGMEEGMNLICDLRMARMLDLDLALEEDLSLYDALLYEIQPAHLQEPEESKEPRDPIDPSRGENNLRQTPSRTDKAHRRKKRRDLMQDRLLKAGKEREKDIKVKEIEKEDTNNEKTKQTKQVKEADEVKQAKQAKEVKKEDKEQKEDVKPDRRRDRKEED